MTATKMAIELCNKLNIPYIVNPTPEQLAELKAKYENFVPFTERGAEL